MPELQRIFTSSYAIKLRNDIDPDNYTKDPIPYDLDQVRRLNGIERPDNLEEKMLQAESELDAAILLYEAYPQLTPAIASHAEFWLYLTHVDLARYVRREWPDLVQHESGKNKGKLRTEEEMKSYIRDHWLISRNGVMRTSLMGLWWSVHLSIDKTPGIEDPYHLTRVFFKNNGMRTRRLGTGHLGRNQAALHGILSFMEMNPDIFETGFENRMIWITRHFNLLGGTRPLSFMPEEFFYQELENNKGYLKGIQKREDVIGQDAYI